MATAITLLLISTSLAIFYTAAASEHGYALDGRVRLDGAGRGGGGGVSSKLANAKVILNGGQQLTFVRSDGLFSFQGVPAGTHLLEVSAMGYTFSPVRVDISARLHGQVRAIAVQTRRSYTDSFLILEPIGEESYYEKREPFSVAALLKSPMGLMVGFMVVAVFLLPKLMDSVDPEEMKRVQEELQNQPAPSFSNLLSGGGGS